MMCTNMLKEPWACFMKSSFRIRLHPGVFFLSYTYAEVLIPLICLSPSTGSSTVVGISSALVFSDDVMDFYDVTFTLFGSATGFCVSYCSGYIRRARWWISVSEWFFYPCFSSELSLISGRVFITRKPCRWMRGSISKYYLDTGFFCKRISCKFRGIIWSKNYWFSRRRCVFLSSTFFWLSSISFFWWGESSLCCWA